MELTDELVEKLRNAIWDEISWAKIGSPVVANRELNSATEAILFRVCDVIQNTRTTPPQVKELVELAEELEKMCDGDLTKLLGVSRPTPAFDLQFWPWYSTGITRGLIIAANHIREALSRFRKGQG